MKVQKTDDERTLTPAQIEFCKQLELSDQSGQALWWPKVATDGPTPDCVVFLKEISRFAVMIPTVSFSDEDDGWFRYDADGGRTSVPDLIKETWQAATHVRLSIKGQLDIGAYTIPVIILNDVVPDDSIKEVAQGYLVKAFFGQDDVAQQLVNLPNKDQLQPQLNSRFIQEEVEALRRSPAAKSTAPEPTSLELGDGRLLIQHVDVVNIYLTGDSVGNDGEPPINSR